MIAWLKQQVLSKDKLEDKIYVIVLIVGTLTNLVSFIITCIERLDKVAILSTFLCFVAMGVFWYLSVAKGLEEKLRIPLLSVIIYGLLPVAWFCCGGVRSGMILYCMSCLFMIVPCIPERGKRVAYFTASLLWLLCMVAFSVYCRPDLVLEFSDEQWYVDVLVSLPICSAGVFAVTALIVRSYETERKNKESLLEQLERLSRYDALTGLYNRRALFERFEEEQDIVTNPKRYLLMMDVDSFKKVNDTYGHGFGDQALSAVASVLQANADEDKNDYAARYGGEEFVVVLSANDPAEAAGRAEKIRAGISELAFAEQPEVHISVSGGLVRVCDFRTVSEALSKADKLLYNAKAQGKNRIM